MIISFSVSHFTRGKGISSQFKEIELSLEPFAYFDERN